MVNYFTYDYPDPIGEHPFSITTDVGPAPWNAQHKLVRIGLQGRRMDLADQPQANLVFLIDVSGSMQSPNKLALLKQAFRLLGKGILKCSRTIMVRFNQKLIPRTRHW